MVKNFKKWLTKVVTQFNPQLHRCGKQIENKRSNRFSPESNLTVQANRSGSCPINVFNVKEGSSLAPAPHLLPNFQANPQKRG